MGAEPAADRRGLIAAAAALAGAVAIALAGEALGDPFLVVVAALALACGVLCSRAVGLLAVLALLAALVLQGGSIVPWLLVTAGPWIVGDAVRRRRRLVVALGERTRELEAEQHEHARLAVARERARIAQELHDIVAHHLAVVVVLAGAGRLAPDDAEADAERLAEIRRSGGLALAELDRLVELLEDRGAPPPRPLEVLVEQAQAAGLALRTSPLPPGTVLPGPVEECAYRIVQEGLTNALKHAPGSEVHVRLAAQGGALAIEVADEGARGPASALAESGSGLGLAGMRERVAALGGRLDAGPAAGGRGWRVRARIPLAGDRGSPPRGTTPARDAGEMRAWN